MSNSQDRLPTQSRGGLIAASILLLLGAGALVLWKIDSKEAPKEVTPLSASSTEAPTAPVNDAPPPPPPPPPEEQNAVPAPLSAPKPKKKAPSNSVCSSPCEGAATPMLRGALKRRGGAARSCYNKALRNNPSLKGKMLVRVKIDPNGTVCSAQAVNSTLQDPSVAACVVQKFRSANFPPAHGGCVDTEIPLSFSAN